MEVTPGSLALVVDESAGLEAEVSDGSTGVEWSSTDPSVASVDGAGVVRAVSEGTARIEAVATSDSDARGSVDVTVTDACAEVEGTAAVGDIGGAGARSKGTLGAGDCLRDGLRADRWSVVLASDAGLGFTLDASFSARLILEDEAGNLLLDTGRRCSWTGSPRSWMRAITGSGSWASPPGRWAATNSG